MAGVAKHILDDLQDVPELLDCPKCGSRKLFMRAIPEFNRFRVECAACGYCKRWSLYYDDAVRKWGMSPKRRIIDDF